MSLERGGGHVLRYGLAAILIYLGAFKFTAVEAQASLIALRPCFPRLAALGSLGAIGVFATTLSFLVTTPGVWAWVEMFPLPVPSEAGGFLLKDVFLLGAAAWSAGEAWRAASVG